MAHYVERRARVDKKPFASEIPFWVEIKTLTSMGKDSWFLDPDISFIPRYFYTEWGLVKDQTFWIILYLPLLIPWLNLSTHSLFREAPL